MALSGVALIKCRMEETVQQLTSLVSNKSVSEKNVFCFIKRKTNSSYWHSLTLSYSVLEHFDGPSWSAYNLDTHYTRAKCPHKTKCPPHRAPFGMTTPTLLSHIYSTYHCWVCMTVPVEMSWPSILVQTWGCPLTGSPRCSVGSTRRHTWSESPHMDSEGWHKYMSKSIQELVAQLCCPVCVNVCVCAFVCV